MKRLYILIVLCAIAGGALAQAPTGYEAEPAAERVDISKSVHIFPNPATEYINVRLETIKVDGIKVTVHNLIGNEIKVESEKLSEHELKIPVKDFDAGYYLLSLKDENSNFKGIFKFVKR